MTQISVRSSSIGIPFASSGCRKRSHGDTSIGSFSYHGRGWKLWRQQRRRSFHHGDAVPHRPLHLLEGTHAYLAHALARDAELVGKLAERDRFFGEPTRLEDASRPLVERGGRRGERLAPRFSTSSLAASVVSWSACSSTNRSSHSPELPSSRIGALSEASPPPSRRFMWITSVWVTPSCRAMIFTSSGRMSPSSSTVILFL